MHHLLFEQSYKHRWYCFSAALVKVALNGPTSFLSTAILPQHLRSRCITVWPFPGRQPVASCSLDQAANRIVRRRKHLFIKPECVSLILRIRFHARKKAFLWNRVAMPVKSLWPVKGMCTFFSCITCQVQVNQFSRSFNFSKFYDSRHGILDHTLMCGGPQWAGKREGLFRISVWWNINLICFIII